MRLRIVLGTLLVSSFAAAEPDDPYPEPPPDAPAPTEPAPPPAPIVTTPPGVVPPITINITNNNTGNNSNTNTQTNTAPVNVSTPVTVSTDVATPVNVDTPVTSTIGLPLQPPGTVVLRQPPTTIERIQMVAPERVRSKWFAIGVTGGKSGHGVRASLDLFGRGPFTIGIAANASGGHGHGDGGPSDVGGLEGSDAGGPGARGDRSGSAVAYLAFTKRLRRVDVRMQFGLGFGGRADRDEHPDDKTLARTVGGESPETDQDRHHESSPRAEAALLVSLPLTKRLGLIAGPILSATHDNDDKGDERILDGGDHGGRGHGRPDVDARFMAGLRLAF